MDGGQAADKTGTGTPGMPGTGIIHAKRLVSRQNHNREPDDEVFMSCQFARILERELQAAGLSPLDVPARESEAASRRSTAGSASSLPLPSPDRSAFSVKAMNLSCSLRHYARDAERPGQSDPSVITGWNEAGYLRDTGRGLSGEMRFTTASGVAVTISAGQENRADIRVRAVKDGSAHVFSLDDFSQCDSGAEASAVFPVRVALPSGRESEETPPLAVAYGPTGVPPAAARPSIAAQVC